MGKELHIVTGAAGRLGFPLCMELVKRGNAVRALYLTEDGVVEELRGMGCETVRCDVTDPQSIDAAFNGGTYVYHLAGIISIESKISEMLERVNVQGTQNVIDGCVKHKIKRLVYTGSVHMLDTRGNKKRILTEPKNFEPEFLYGGYAQAKAKAGNLVLRAVSEGLDAVIAMPSGIIGPYEFQNSNFGEMVAQVADGKLRVYVRGKYDFVDARDVANALCDLAVRGEKGGVYIASGHIITIKELMNIAAETANVRRIKHFVPMFLAKMFARIAERSALRKKRKPTFTPYSMKVVTDNCNFSHEKLTRLTGYAPRPVRESVREHTLFYLKNRSGL